ncbi:DUF2785 domain-containing protein [Ktedonospora formicarum]|uniref:Membrane protein n=1 Tax=Ktedonospora formicarum TaxID=2778364 RepID=A0A8J3MQJ9_9CHLR|nr:DUF2785 domain-containing protein [Ktedonospora formicarum]GHO44035.1 membrane protein [Ktedonospora formicarum]
MMEKAFWLEIAANEYTLPSGFSASELLPELLENLGSINSDLREHAYMTLALWIERDCLYTSEELYSVAAQLRSNLRLGLGEEGTDSVFLRSFSLLVLNNVVDYDNAHPFLQEQDVLEWLKEALAYYQSERDLRGYVSVKGWAHSVAHGADLLLAFAHNRYVHQLELEHILDVVAWRITAPAHEVFIDREDERLAVVVFEALSRELLPMSFLQQWIQGIVKPEGRKPWNEAFNVDEENRAFCNTRQFLNGLYFQLLLRNKQPATSASLREVLVQAIRELGPYFYE